MLGSMLAGIRVSGLWLDEHRLTAGEMERSGLEEEPRACSNHRQLLDRRWPRVVDVNLTFSKGLTLAGIGRDRP